MQCSQDLIKRIEGFYTNINFDATDPTRSVENIYSSLYILNTVHNATNAQTWVPAIKTCVEFISVITLFGTIRYINKIHPIVYAGIAVAALLFYSQAMMVITLLSNINTNSLKLKPNFKRQLINSKSLETTRTALSTSEKYWTNVILSRRPIQSKIGTPYFVEKATKLKYAGILIDSVLSLLVATK